MAAPVWLAHPATHITKSTRSLSRLITLVSIPPVDGSLFMALLALQYLPEDIPLTAARILLLGKVSCRSSRLPNRSLLSRPASNTAAGYPSICRVCKHDAPGEKGGRWRNRGVSASDGTGGAMGFLAPPRPLGGRAWGAVDASSVGSERGLPGTEKPRRGERVSGGGPGARGSARSRSWYNATPTPGSKLTSG